VSAGLVGASLGADALALAAEGLSNVFTHLDVAAGLLAGPEHAATLELRASAADLARRLQALRVFADRA
jgi:hypothetical protein